MVSTSGIRRRAARWMKLNLLAAVILSLSAPAVMADPWKDESGRRRHRHKVEDRGHKHRNDKHERRHYRRDDRHSHAYRDWRDGRRYVRHYRYPRHERYVTRVPYPAHGFAPAPVYRYHDEPFFFSAELGVFFDNGSLSISAGNYAPEGYSYWDPYCAVPFVSITEYHYHLYDHHHHPLVEVVPYHLCH